MVKWFGHHERNCAEGLDMVSRAMADAGLSVAHITLEVMLETGKTLIVRNVPPSSTYENRTFASLMSVLKRKPLYQLIVTKVEGALDAAKSERLELSVMLRKGDGLTGVYVIPGKGTYTTEDSARRELAQSQLPLYIVDVYRLI